MILTVTLNAAVDVTYFVDRLEPHGSHRVDTAYERAGGKGVNAARVLTTLGEPVVATGLCGGATGGLLREELHTAGIAEEFVPVEGSSRRTVTVVSREDGDATVFNQAGPHVRAAEWTRFTRRYAELVRGAAVVVLAGSLPPGLPSGACAQLLDGARRAGARTVLDTSGPALGSALTAGPDVVKPNADELAAVTGHFDPVAGAAQLRARGASSVVVSRGPEGLHADVPDGRWQARPPERLAGNPTGAGDACVAALAAGLAAGRPWPAILREAVALSAAAVAAPVAGDFDAGVHRRLRTAAVVKEFDAHLH